MEPNILSLLTFCLGLILGHRLTLWRDKRKEFNDISQPLRDILLKERGYTSPNASGIGIIDADTLESVLPFWKRRAFRNSWDAYKQSKNETWQDSCGQPFYTHPENIILHIDNILSYTRRQ